MYPRTAQQVTNPFVHEGGSSRYIFYTNLVGNVGLIRRTLAQDAFQGREDKAPNYNPHPSPRAGTGQIICPKKNVGILIEGLKRKKIEKLPDSYSPTELSPRSKHLGLWRERVLKNHQTEVLRNWERCSKNPSDEGIAEKFEELLEEAKSIISKNSVKKWPEDRNQQDKQPSNEVQKGDELMEENPLC